MIHKSACNHNRYLTLVTATLHKYPTPLRNKPGYTAGEGNIHSIDTALPRGAAPTASLLLFPLQVPPLKLQARPRWQPVCAPGGRAPGSNSSGRGLTCTQQTRRNMGLYDDTLSVRVHSPAPHARARRGLQAPSQKPGEVSRVEEVEEAEPLTKALSSGQGAPGADLGTALAKTSWLFCFLGARKTQSNTLIPSHWS